MTNPTSSPENPLPSDPQSTARESVSETVLPDWVRQDRRKRFLSRRNIFLIMAVVIALGFVVWLNFPFVPDPVILLSRQPDQIFGSGSIGDEWTMAGRGVGQTRYVADALDLPEGQLAWSVATGPATSAAPVIYDGRIYLPGHFRIAVLDAENGGELDSIPTSGPMHNSIALAEGNMYYATIDRRLVSRGLTDNRINWEFATGDSTAGPVSVSNGIVYAGALNGIMYAVNASTGRRVWQHETLSEVRSPAAALNKWAYVASADRSLYALDARTGQERARFRTTASLVSAPVAANDLVYFVSGGDLHAMDADALEFPGRFGVTRTWLQLWLWGFPLPTPPSQPGDRWRFNPEGKSIEGIISAPAVTQDRLFVGDLLGIFYAVNPHTGDPIWKFVATDSIVASPVVAGNLVMFGDKAGMVYGLDQTSGHERWRLQLPAAVRTDPVFAGGRLLIRTEDGGLHAID